MFYLFKYFLSHALVAIKNNKLVKMINVITSGKNHMDTILPSIAKPSLENNMKVKTILPTKHIETGTAYFHGVKSTTDLSLKTKGSFNGFTFPKTNKNNVSNKKSNPWMWMKFIGIVILKIVGIPHIKK